MPQTVAVPTTKLSAAILDFAAPFLAFYAPVPTEDEARGALYLVIALWNANVMASPVWGKPQHREALLAKLASNVPSPIRAILEDLDRTWHKRFSDDPRFVGEWTFGVDDAGATTLVCPAHLPQGVTAVYVDPASPGASLETKKRRARRARKKP